MSVSVNYKLQATVAETLETNVGAATTPLISHDAFNVFGTLTASTGVPATKWAAFTATLSGGSLTIDLTSLTGTNGASVTFSGLKVQAFLFVNGTVSAGVITPGGNSVVQISDGSSNGYNIFGAASRTVSVLPGDAILHYHGNTLQDVGASDLAIDLAGTGTDSFLCAMAAG